LHDFYFTGDDYRYRFEVDAKQHFIQVLRERFNSGVRYKGQILKWDTVIEHKTNELARFLVGKSTTLDLTEPAPKLERQDNREFRAKILALSVTEARRLGIGKSTFHYLRQNLKNQTFKCYHKTRKKIELQAGR
jgi:hypothetical protein